MSMAQGFAQGFGMMNQYMTQKSEQERQAALDAENNRRYQEGIEWRNKTYTDQQTRQQKQDEEAAENRTLTQAQLGLTPDMTPEQKAGYLQNMHAVKLQQDAEDRQWARKKDEAQIAASRASTQNSLLSSKKLNHELLKQDQQEALQRIFIGAGTLDDVKKVGGYAQGMTARLDSFNAFANKYDAINQQAAKATTSEEKEAAAFALLELTNSPEGRDVMQSAFMPDLERRAKANPNIERIGMAGFEVIGNKLVPLLDIKYKDGKTAERVPATRNMSSDKDDHISLLDFGSVRNQVSQAYVLQKNLQEMVSQNPAVGRFIYGMKPGDEIKSGYGAMYNTITGEQVKSPNGKYDASGLDKDTVFRHYSKIYQNALETYNSLGVTSEAKNEALKVMQQAKDEMEAIQGNIGNGAGLSVTPPQQATSMQPTTSGAKTGSSQFSYGKIGINPDSIPNKK